MRRTTTVLALVVLSLLLASPSRHSHSLFDRADELATSHRASDCPACVRENAPAIASEAPAILENGSSAAISGNSAATAASVALPARVPRGPPSSS